jgi:hypothetical protein
MSHAESPSITFAKIAENPAASATYQKRKRPPTRGGRPG